MHPKQNSIDTIQQSQQQQQEQQRLSESQNNSNISENESNNEYFLSVDLNENPSFPINKNTFKKNEAKINFKSFKIEKLLGEGSFGQVFLVEKKNDQKLYAMKALKKRQLIMKNQLKYAITEAEVLKQANHPFIICLHYAFQTPQYLYMILDYCPGGDLSYHLAQYTKFEENISRFYIAELILAIERLHEMNVVYRDLKPENIIIGQDKHIKLADFGLAKQGIDKKETAKSFCGSPAYLSPEMLKNQGVGKASDIYGIGTVLYEMLTGNPPYYADNIPTLYKNIAKGNLTYPEDVSPNARDLLEKLLNQNPDERIGVFDKDEIKKHVFFKGIDWEKLMKKRYQPPNLEYNNNDNSFVNEGKDFFDIDYNENNSKINRIEGFSYSKDDISSKGNLIFEFS